MPVDMREVTISREMAIAIANDTADIPEAMKVQIKQKCIDSLRLCLTAQVPPNYHGPELMPHMLPKGVYPSEPKVPLVHVTPRVKEVTEQKVPDIKEVSYKYAYVSDQLIESMVVFDRPSKIFRFPQQPFVVRLPACELNCETAAVQLAFDRPVAKLYINRSINLIKPGRFYCATLPGDASDYHKIYDKYYSYTYDLAYASHTLILQPVCVENYLCDLSKHLCTTQRMWFAIYDTTELDIEDRHVIKHVTGAAKTIGPIRFYEEVDVYFDDDLYDKG